jgi:hypothetical protein
LFEYGVKLALSGPLQERDVAIICRSAPNNSSKEKVVWYFSPRFNNDEKMRELLVASIQHANTLPQAKLAKERYQRMVNDPFDEPPPTDEQTIIAQLQLQIKEIKRQHQHQLEEQQRQHQHQLEEQQQACDQKLIEQQKVVDTLVQRGIPFVSVAAKPC